MKANKYEKTFNGHVAELAIRDGYIEIGLNEWANKDDIRKLCDCKRLTRNGFVPIKKDDTEC